MASGPPSRWCSRGAAARCCARTCGWPIRPIPAFRTPTGITARDAAPVIAQIRAGGGRAFAVEADVSDPAAPGALFDAAEEHLGPVDILVITPAGGWPTPSRQQASTGSGGRFSG
jgi:NAD(P)-dependent dehydrogenase (short-subunit alcohol dehydrogenase family)